MIRRDWHHALGWVAEAYPLPLYGPKKALVAMHPASLPLALDRFRDTYERRCAPRTRLWPLPSADVPLRLRGPAGDIRPATLSQKKSSPPQLPHISGPPWRTPQPSAAFSRNSWVWSIVWPASCLSAGLILFGTKYTQKK